MVGVILFHVSKKAVSLHIFVNEIGFTHNGIHNITFAFVLKAEEVLCIDSTDNVVHAFAADRENGVTCTVDSLLPYVAFIGLPQN